MAASNLELPAKVFVIGTPQGKRNVTLHNGVWDASLLFTCIWTTKSDLESWLSAHPSEADYFEIDAFTIFGDALFRRDFKYLLVNPPPELSHHSNGKFYLHSHAVEAKIDLHSPMQLLDALEGNLRQSGVPEERIEAARTLAQADGQLSPFDVLLRFSPFRGSEAVLRRCSGSVVRRMKLEENVWQFLGLGSWSQKAVFLAIWDGHPELTFDEMQNHWNLTYMTALERRIADLKASGDFPLVFDYLLAASGMMDALESFAKPFSNMVSELNEWTLKKVSQQVDIALSFRRQNYNAGSQQIWNVMVALLQLKPGDPCVRCGEILWQYESSSPSGKAATWRCGYCRKTVIVKEEDLKPKTPKANREPIPKGVQKEVWQRDGGKCVRCGSQEFLEFDHIIAVSQGGSNTARNLQVLCENCNRKKSGKPPGEA